MRTLSFFFSVTLIFLTGCVSKEDIPPMSDKEISLKYEKHITLPLQGITLSFLSLESDSRCPEEVTCIWEGEVVVKLGVALIGQEPQSFIVGISPRPDVPQSFTFEDYTIELIEVNPYPVQGVNVPLKKYEVVLKVTQ
ncbi:MAG: hypothetical protein SF052_13070 [Bacteroidia bacterium]|nr:hypothetical protein [Bacteroidia bacterium]